MDLKYSSQGYGPGGPSIQSLDWTGGLDWWTDIFMLSNDTHLPVELCGSPAALFLATYMVPEQITH